MVGTACQLNIKAAHADNACHQPERKMFLVKARSLLDMNFKKADNLIFVPSRL